MPGPQGSRAPRGSRAPGLPAGRSRRLGDTTTAVYVQLSATSFSASFSAGGLLPRAARATSASRATANSTKLQPRQAAIVTNQGAVFVSETSTRSAALPGVYLNETAPSPGASAALSARSLSASFASALAGIVARVGTARSLAASRSTGALNLPMALDGVEAFGVFDTGAATVTLTLTTTKPNCIIFVAMRTASSSPISISDTAGSTFTPRFFGTDAFYDLALWWALKPLPGTDVITIQLDFITGGGNPTLAFAVRGADPANPFDPNPSLPAINVNDTNATGVTTTFSTDKSPDFVYGIVRQYNDYGPPPTGLISHP